jgi:hypothetical protein
VSLGRNRRALWSGLVTKYCNSYAATVAYGLWLVACLRAAPFFSILPHAFPVTVHRRRTCLKEVQRRRASLYGLSVQAAPWPSLLPQEDCSLLVAALSIHGKGLGTASDSAKLVVDSCVQVAKGLPLEVRYLRTRTWSTVSRSSQFTVSVQLISGA